jgi:ribosomal protein L34
MAKIDIKRLLQPEINVRAAELLGFLARAKDDGGRHPLDAKEAMDAMVVALATIIEAVPEYATRRDFREAAEEIGSEVLNLALAMRRSFDLDGKHHVERMGGIVADETRPTN